MTNEKILKLALEKAAKNGWQPKGFERDRTDEQWKWFVEPITECFQFIFNHDFAKAFWKESKTRWDVHLQRMVIWPNPLEYLERCLEGDYD